MNRVVLDTMVLASGLTSQAGASGWLLDRWHAGVFELIVSEHLLAELNRTLREDRSFRARLTSAHVDGFLALLRDAATVAELTVLVSGAATQPKDDLVLSTALSGGASYLATRDRQLLRLTSYRGLAIVSPGELRAVLAPDEAETP